RRERRDLLAGERHAIVARGELGDGLLEVLPRARDHPELLLAARQVEQRSHLRERLLALAEQGERRLVIAVLESLPALPELFLRDLIGGLRRGVHGREKPQGGDEHATPAKHQWSTSSHHFQRSSGSHGDGGGLAWPAGTLGFGAAGGAPRNTLGAEFDTSL